MLVLPVTAAIPGIGSMELPDGCVVLQGTSMAAPHVAGVAALIISRTATKRMAPAQVAAALIATATPKPCPKREYRLDTTLTLGLS